MAVQELHHISLIANSLETLLAHGREWLVESVYSLADISWYSKAAAFPRVLPEECTADATLLALA